MTMPRPDTPRMKPGTLLFLMALPFVAIIFVFYYLPLYGWVYALFDYKPGLPLSECRFVGLEFFGSLFDTPSGLAETWRVLSNTLGISGLWLLGLPLPMLLAILINEVGSKGFRKFVQTATTLPYFFSWVLVYALFYSMFSTDDGLVNKVLVSMGAISEPVNFLASRDHVWLTQWLIRLWKEIGWNTIIYLAAIAGIDPELYDAAKVDGAGRFRSMLHVTLPGMVATFFVLLLLSIGNIVNNGFEQYFVFQNPMNKNSIEVLDLYVYNQGISSIYYSYSTAICVLKSVVSVLLLVGANGLSRLVRRESII